MRVSGEDLRRAMLELARGNARLRTELRAPHDFRQFPAALQRALEAVAVYQEVSRAGRVAWKLLRALRVEGD